MANEIEKLMGVKKVKTADDDLKDRCLDFLKRYWNDVELMASQREDLMNSYLCRPYGNEVTGRSQVVMSDTLDTIEWVMPQLMRIFYGGRDVVRIEGEGPEDVQGAKLLHEKVNHDFQRGNQGFLILHDWFKDALLQKIGVVKWWWEEGEHYRPKEYTGLNEEEYGVLKANPDFRIEDHSSSVSQEASFDPITGAPIPEVLNHDVTGTVVRKYSGPKAAVMAPEEFIFNSKCADITEEDFVAHRKRVHKSVLMSDYGLTEDDLLTESQAIFDGQDYYARFKDLGGVGFLKDLEDKDYYYIHECCINDYSSGKKVPTLLTLMGSKEIRRQKNKYGKPNYCSMSPIRMAHRALGRCLADLTLDLQKLKTSIARYCMDNIYYQNNGMAIVNPWKLNMADLLNPAPGKLVRMKEDEPVQNSYFPIPVTPFGAHAFGMLDRVDDWQMKRTGVTSYSQGLDANALNKTATGISQIMSASMARIEHMARIFAETGVKDLFEAFAQMNIDYLQESTDIPSRLNAGWMEIEPGQIDVFYDVVIDVGLGTGSREQMAQQMTQMLQTSLSPNVIQSGVFQPMNLYNLLSTIYELIGTKNAGPYLTKPPEQMNAGPNAGPGQGIPGLATPGAVQEAGAVPGGATPAGLPPAQ